jgi:hypothetical protein
MMGGNRQEPSHRPFFDEEIVNVSTKPTAAAPLTIDEASLDFLRRQGAEEAFRTACDLARQCYPELLRMETELWEDPEIIDRWRVVVWTTLPPDHPLDLFQRQKDHYHHRLAELVPFRYSQHFIIRTHFATD